MNVRPECNSKMCGFAPDFLIGGNFLYLLFFSRFYAQRDLADAQKRRSTYGTTGRSWSVHDLDVSGS